jgi:hypothetical protein
VNLSSEEAALSLLASNPSTYRQGEDDGPIFGKDKPNWDMQKGQSYAENCPGALHGQAKKPSKRPSSFGGGRNQKKPKVEMAPPLSASNVFYLENGNLKLSRHKILRFGIQPEKAIQNSLPA